MAITRLDQNLGVGTFDVATTATFNATGATLLWAVCVVSGASAIVFSDSGVNSWHNLTTRSSDTTRLVIGYAYDKSGGAMSLGATQTVTATTTGGSYTAVIAGAVSGTTTDSGVFVGENGASDNGDVTGTITPSQVGDWILTAQGSGGTATTPSAVTGYTTILTQDNSSYMVGSAACLDAASTSAVGATWSGITGNRPCAIAVFKLSGAGGGGGLSSRPSSTVMPVYVHTPMARLLG